MALDPAIILGIQTPKLPTQADIAESQAKIQESRARVEQIKFARQKAIDDAANRAAVNAAVQSNIGPDGIPNFKAAIASLHQSGRTDAAMVLDQAWQKQREAAAQAEDAELKNHNDHAEAVASLLNGATPDNYATRLSYIAAVDPEGAKQLGETYDPQKVEAVKAATIKTVEYNREQAAATKQALSGDVENAIARIMPTVSDDEWANQRHKFIAFGADPAEIPEQPSPEARARVAQLGISAEKRVELEAQAEARKAAAEERAIDNARADKQLGISAAHLRLAQATEARQARQAAAGGSPAETAALVSTILQNPAVYWAQTPKVKAALAMPLAAAGYKFPMAPTADMRNKEQGREFVAKSINAIEDLSTKIITKVGPAQRAQALVRGTEAVFGNDPNFRTYQDARTALAGNLAVAQQGSRPSDADIKAIWLPLVPDAYRDTSESAKQKWDLIKIMSNVPSSGGAGGVQQRPIPGIPGGIAELQNGKWIRIK